MSKKTVTTAPQPAVQETPPLAETALMSVVRANQQQWMEHTGNARRHGEQARQIRQRIEEMFPKGVPGSLKEGRPLR
jgi:hypothetical protein